MTICQIDAGNFLDFNDNYEIFVSDHTLHISYVLKVIVWNFWTLFDIRHFTQNL